MLIAGDVYDKSVPSAEAVGLLDDFLVDCPGGSSRSLSSAATTTRRSAWPSAGGCMERSGVHLAPVYDGKVRPFALSDEYGPVKVYLLPFVKPSHVRRCFPDREIATYTDALSVAIGAMEVDRGGAERTGDPPVCHRRCPMRLGGDLRRRDGQCGRHRLCPLRLCGPGPPPRPAARWAGRRCATAARPLKYSFSEAGQQKSVTVVELGEKGSVAVRTVPLTPLRDLVELRGTYQELTFRGFYEGTSYQRDYVHITLTDEEDIPDAVSKLRIIYPNLMKLDYDNQRTRAGLRLEGAEDAQRRSPLELLEEFYEKQNGQPMGQEQRSFARAWMERIWEEDEA